MACILDYLDWRGDLPLQAVPFCEVDAVILTRLSYLPFGGIVGEAPVSLGDAAARVRRLLGPEGDGREVRNGRDLLLLDALVDSPRFSALSLAGYVERFDKEAEKQFSAITVLLPDGIFVAYRGTDGTVIGWKEDFNMGFADHVPAQTDAMAYLEEAAGRYPGTIRVGGHSKGGNLAVYAAAFCAPEIQARILSVQNNDGPGFPDAVAVRESFRRIWPRVHTYLPQSSVVGLLMGHGEAYTIVHSTNSGLKQHDMYSWEVARDHLAVAEGFTEGEMAQWLLLSKAPAVRPMRLAAAVLRGQDLEMAGVTRVNRGEIVNLPRNAVIESDLTLRGGVEVPHGYRLPAPLAQCCMDIDEAARLAAQAATGDRTALRECVEIDPAMEGLDRLYCQQVVDALIHLHGDVLGRLVDDDEDDDWSGDD